MEIWMMLQICNFRKKTHLGHQFLIFITNNVAIKFNINIDWEWIKNGFENVYKMGK